MRCSQFRAVKAFSGRLARLGLSQHPGLLFRIYHEGYRDFAYGALAGPVVSGSNLFHELAHAAELGGEAFERRVDARGFGFDVPQVWVYDRFCSEPKTMQATARELRTFAYQFHLMRMAGYRIEAQAFAAQCALIMRFMEDCYFVPGDGEQGRAQWCGQRILAHIEEVRSKEALARLVDCLDRTCKKLKALEATGPSGLYSSAQRYRADGSPYVH